MDSTKLRALLKSKSDCQFDVCDITCLNLCWGSPKMMTQKIMEIRKSTAAAYASATIKPQPFSPISSLTSSTPHSKPVSSPHSDIIPMAQEQISPVVQNGDKEDLFAMCQSKAIGTRKTIRRRKHMSDPTQLGSMP